MNSVEMENLNTLLKGELSAVASYGVALDKVREPHVKEVLLQARDSHAERVDKLRTAIVDSGGAPIETSGTWGSFAKLVTSTAAAMGEVAIVAALEEGEDLGSNEYEWKMLNIRGANHRLVRDELWPKQQATHKLMSTLTARKADGSWPPTPQTRDA